MLIMLQDIINTIIFLLICLLGIIFHVIASFVEGLVLIFWGHANKKTLMIPQEEKLVVVTGCDTGFGRLLVEDLKVTTQFNILALTLTQDAANELQEIRVEKEEDTDGSNNAKSKNDEDHMSRRRFLHAIKCDVTSDKDVEKMKQTVVDLCTTHNTKLYGIVNNAGTTTGVGSFLFYSSRSPDKIIQNMNVNYFGMLRVTCALQYLLIQSNCNGRIVNLSSTAGASAIPLNGAYNASKHAVEAYSDTLATETKPFGVHVVKVRPGNFATGMFQVWLENIIQSFESCPLEIQDVFGGNKWIEALRNFFEPVGLNGASPQLVVNVLKESLLSSKPKSCSWVGNDAKTLNRAIATLPDNISSRIRSLFYVGPMSVGQKKKQNPETKKEL